MNSFLNKAFGFNPLVHKKSKEITAGITTFLTMSFMCLPVIPQAKITDKGLFISGT